MASHFHFSFLLQIPYFSASTLTLSSDIVRGVRQAGIRLELSAHISHTESAKSWVLPGEWQPARWELPSSFPGSTTGRRKMTRFQTLSLASTFRFTLPYFSLMHTRAERESSTEKQSHHSGHHQERWWTFSPPTLEPSHLALPLSAQSPSWRAPYAENLSLGQFCFLSAAHSVCIFTEQVCVSCGAYTQNRVTLDQSKKPISRQSHDNTISAGILLYLWASLLGYWLTFPL